MNFLDFIENITNKKQKIHCLLVQPNYYSTYPPLGLLKISSLIKQYGNTAELVSPPKLPLNTPDIIFITSLFTYGWKKVKEAADFYRKHYSNVPIVIGGIYATLMEDHVKEVINPNFVWKGVIEEAEELLPDYSLVPDWKASILFSSRGCIRRCPFCVVWKMEPVFYARDRIDHLVAPEHDAVIFWDNNFLASPYKFEIFDFLESYRNNAGKRIEVDFNQGLDARLLTPPVAERLARLKIKLIRLAYDRRGDRKHIEKAIKILEKVGINKRKILVYTLFNFKDTPEEFLERLKDLMNWGVVSYPMRYQPNDALEKDKYVSPFWTEELLEMVAKARRVLGAGGAFPPYEGLKKKILSAKTLEEAMYLREPTKKKVRLEVSGKR